MNPVPAIAARRAPSCGNLNRDLVQLSSKSLQYFVQCACLYFQSTMATNCSARQSSPTSAGALLRLIRDGVAVTRADLARVTGLARSTVAQRVDALLAQGWSTRPAAAPRPAAARPPCWPSTATPGVVLVADLGATHARVAVSDLAGTPLAERASDLDIALGPEHALGWVARALRRAARRGRTRSATTCAGSASACRGRSSSPAGGR